jgi:RimJ/RimL family protein N-acetyltransferase
MEIERKYFPGDESRNAYLLMESAGEIIGWISHAYKNSNIENMEIDIMFKALKYTGKGVGSKIIAALTDYLNEKYGIKTFIIRPGKHNARAIRAYEKAGFAVMDTFDPNDYYEAEDVTLWGDGDYGADGTVNMIKIYDKEKTD